MSFNSHNSGNFHRIQKSKMSKPNLGSRLCKTEIEQKALVLLLIKHRTFLGTPGMSNFLVLSQTGWQFILGKDEKVQPGFDDFQISPRFRVC